jgi:hypothetical protein
MPVKKGPAGVRQELTSSKNLHSGSKHGPVATSHKQAIAIALSEAGMSKNMSKMHSVHKDCTKANFPPGVCFAWPGARHYQMLDQLQFIRENHFCAYLSAVLTSETYDASAQQL